MNKHLKLFVNHTVYEAAKNTIDKPNVVMCQQEDEVHYNPHETKLVVCYDIQNISGPTNIWTNYGGGNIKSMEVDGVLLDSLTTTYQFNTVGEHIVKYEFNNSTIGNNTPLFYNLTNIKSIIIPDTITTISDNAFHSCGTLITMTIPNSVVNIGYNAFQSCDIKVLNYDSNVAFDYIFINAPLETVNIGDLATTLSGNLDRIQSIRNVIIGSNITSISNSVFVGCYGITSIIVKPTVPPSDEGSAFNTGNNCPIYVPVGSVEAYKTAWSNYASRIQAIS